MELVVSRQNCGLPEVIENKENRNLQNKPEVLHPVQKGGLPSSELGSASERLRKTAPERISIGDSSESEPLDSRVTVGASNTEGSASASSRSEELSNKDGKVWDCIEAKVDPESGGTLYTFAYNKEKASRCSSVYADTFPAVEYELYNIEKLFESMENPELMERLGYRLDKENGTVTVPDSQVFSHRWEKEQANDPTLPDFKICDAEGIASDEDFIEAMFTHDVVLSSSNEMVHDHFAHIVPLLQQVLETDPDQRVEKYTNARAVFRELIKGIWDEVQTIKAEMDANGETDITKDELNKIITLLGITTDSLNSFGFYREVPELLKAASRCNGSILSTFLRFAKSPEWFKYMNERYLSVSKEDLRALPDRSLSEEALETLPDENISKEALEAVNISEENLQALLDQNLSFEELEALPGKLSQRQNKHKNACEQMQHGKYPCLYREINETFNGYSYSTKENRRVRFFLQKLDQEKRWNLGYTKMESSNGNQHGFPDAKTLDLSWRQMQKDNPSLPNLAIYTALEEPNKMHELLNESPEFFSNHLFLVLPSVLAAFEAENPEQLPKLAAFREGLFLELAQLQEQVENLEHQIQQGKSSPISPRDLDNINYHLHQKLSAALESHKTIEFAEQFPSGKGVIDHFVSTARYSPWEEQEVKEAWAKFREYSNSL